MSSIYIGYRETYSWYDLRLALFTPFSYLPVDLIPQLWLDLARVSGKERQESLRTGVDYIDLVQGDSVNDLFSHLKLAVRTCDETSLACQLHSTSPD